MTLKTLNPPPSNIPFNPTLLTSNYTPVHIADRLRKRGCNGCELGSQANFKAPVVYRGNPGSGRMIIGEAPGLKEDLGGIPFVGPAGELLDLIWKSVGWDTNEDWFLTNIVLCRPVAPPGSGKQNSTPLTRHRKACLPYLRQQIASVKPKIIVLLGASAVKALFPEHRNEPMQLLTGSVLYSDDWPDQVFFVMYHPAYLLHSKRDPEKYSELRQTMWEHIQQLKEIEEEL